MADKQRIHEHYPSAEDSADGRKPYETPKLTKYPPIKVATGYTYYYYYYTYSYGGYYSS